MAFFFSPLLIASALDPGKTLRITEGEKNADCLNRHCFPTIGLSVVDAWRDKRVESGQLIPELESINWQNRRIFLVFDSDVTVKETVRASLHRLAMSLLDKGAAVSVVLLPCELNGDKNGADDFISRHGPDAYSALERIARPAVTFKSSGSKSQAIPWSPEPTETHYKALTAWTVLEGTFANRLNHGLYRWVGTHWELNSGKDRDALKSPIHRWMDEMGWHRRGDSVIGSMTSEVLARLEINDWDPEGVMAFTNGTLRGGIFSLGHDKTDHLTFCFPFPYDIGAKCSRWHQFTRETLGADDVINLLRAAIRWSIIPKPIEQPFTHELVFDVHGPRRAGKGTLSEALQAICGGKEGVGLIRSHTFSNPNALHSLIGKRIALDPDASGHISDPGVFNSISSNEAVEVKKLYKDAGSERLGVVIWRFFNDSPTASGGGIEGMGRRIVTFKFEKAVSTPDEGLKRTLIDEAAGIFWWAWSMSEDAMNEALCNRGKVSAIREASIEGALERDHVLSFSTVVKPDKHKASGLYELYRQWIASEGQKPISTTKFGREIKKLEWVKPTTDWRGAYYETHQPTHQQLASHIGITVDDDTSGGFNSPDVSTHQQNPPAQQPSTEEGSSSSLVSLVSSFSKKRKREEKEEKSPKKTMGKEFGSQPTRPTRFEVLAPVQLNCSSDAACSATYDQPAVRPSGLTVDPCGSPAPAVRLAAHQKHLQANPIQCGSLALGDHFNDLLGQDNPSLPLVVALTEEEAGAVWRLLKANPEETPQELLPLLQKELDLLLPYEQLRALMAEHHKGPAKAGYLPLTDQDRQLQAALDQRFLELVADGSLRLDMQGLPATSVKDQEAA